MELFCFLLIRIIDRSLAILSNQGSAVFHDSLMDRRIIFTTLKTGIIIFGLLLNGLYLLKLFQI